MNTVLVIDDNKAYRTDLLEILAFEDYHPLEAENGQLGLEMIRRYAPDLIVCDVDMPVMNGIELLRKLKANPITALIPFIFASGREDDLIKQAARALGFDHYLTKPFQLADFLAALLVYLPAPIQD